MSQNTLVFDLASILQAIEVNNCGLYAQCILEKYIPKLQFFCRLPGDDNKSLQVVVPGFALTAQDSEPTKDKREFQSLETLFFSKEKNHWDVPLLTVAKYEDQIVVILEILEQEGIDTKCNGLLSPDRNDPFRQRDIRNLPLKDLMFMCSKEDFGFIGHVFYNKATVNFPEKFVPNKVKDLQRKTENEIQGLKQYIQDLQNKIQDLQDDIQESQSLKTLFFSKEKNHWDVPLWTVAKYKDQIVVILEILEQEGIDTKCNGLLSPDRNDPFRQRDIRNLPLKDLMFMCSKEDFGFIGHVFYNKATVNFPEKFVPNKVKDLQRKTENEIQGLKQYIQISNEDIEILEKSNESLNENIRSLRQELKMSGQSE